MAETQDFSPTLLLEILQFNVLSSVDSWPAIFLIQHNVSLWLTFQS
jgi:hypothetical protein